jgi:cardiolipin synthase
MGQVLAQSPWWMLALAGIGALAVAGVIVSLFFAFGRRPQRFSATEAPPVDSDDFLRAVSGTVNAPLMSGGSARILNNGVEIFPAMLGAIARAERSVNFMAYIWEPGTVSDRVLAALEERARAGVQVRLLLDGIGAMHAPDDALRRLEEAGGQVGWFRQFRFGKLTRVHKRNHRRAIVVDGLVGFTGGAAVGDKWLGDADTDEHWRDMMVEVRGCLASNLQSAFTQLWASVRGEILVGKAFYPDEEEAKAMTGGEELSRHVNVISSPANEAHPLRKLFWLSFRCGRKRIWVTSPYFVPDRETRRALADSARAGADVRLLLPDHHTDAKPIRQASHSYYDELMSAGVRIYEYQRTMLHSKTLVVDGVWSVVGSANMDIRSKELNQENVIGILDTGFARQLEETFLDDLKDAREMKLDVWRRRAAWRKAVERFWVLFAEQY